MGNSSAYTDHVYERRSTRAPDARRRLTMNISYGPESLIRSGLLPVLSTSDMRAADEATIAAGTSSAVLMEVAGRAVADVASRVLAEIGGKRVLVACGKGNNGGDGYVVARVLAARGFDVSVISTHEPRSEERRVGEECRSGWVTEVEVKGGGEGGEARKGSDEGRL